MYEAKTNTYNVPEKKCLKFLTEKTFLLIV